ncbi:hypothetical protein NsoK4_00490 [Nitrosopumilus sp. K4]|uniref:hypothetical protein n=1 Tax=Nitrosopumilus sp. K4 TaxID=2795383 RepID=UPI001BAD65A1|nr:hypothetical protein [Nitrosopumilus sp. K4]QUC64802.1 hypothetical protein NsoK4_00490 [Nitrosopumilus sp. K4]
MTFFLDMKNLSKPVKALILASIIITTLTAIELTTSGVDAASISKSLSAGTNTITFRDISDGNVTQTISGTATGNTLTIDVSDLDADLDVLSADVITSSATSTSSGANVANVILTETGPSTGFFSGTVTLSSATTTSSNLEWINGDDISLFYRPDPSDSLTDPKSSEGESLGFPRVSAVLNGVAGAGPLSYTLADFPIDSTAKSDGVCPFTIVVNPVDLTLSSGTTASDITITISYANGILGDPALFPPNLLKMAYRTSSAGTFTEIASTIDFSAKTLTNTAQPSAIEGQYVIGFNTGCSGGGGGGLVSPGLVVNALAGISGISGGGGSSTSAPSISLNDLVARDAIDVPTEIEQMVLNHDSAVPIPPMEPGVFGDFDFPLMINGKGFVAGGFTNTLETQTLLTETPVTMEFVVYEDEKVQHFSLYTNLRGPDDTISKSDTQILYNDGKDLQVVDPNGFFSDAKITVSDDEDEDESFKKHVLVELVFAKPMDTSDIIIRSWDPHLFSRDFYLLDAIKVDSAEPEFNPLPQATEEVQVEELKSQSIPLWVKNNAGWWAEEQIDDENFVAGIQYLIQNEIMFVPTTDAVNSATEIPDWIKNNAGWWAEDQINDEDFVNAIEWLVTNGVIVLE